MYPGRYCFNGVDCIVRSIIIEDVEKQQNILLSMEKKLVLGDSIYVSFKFGHNTAKKEEPENWVDVYVEGVYKVLKIFPQLNTIELGIRKVKL